jgi:hypothetical protein
MISVVIVIRRRKVVHMTFLSATVAILEVLALGRLPRIAAISRFIRARVLYLIAVTRFHFGALPLIIAIQRCGIPLHGDHFALAVCAPAAARCDSGE